MKTKIVLLPLDERPCNFQFPLKLFSNKDLDIVRPEKLGDKKKPASIPKLQNFLLRECMDADSLIVSMDMLLYGGLVPSRLHHESTEALMERIGILREIRRRNPKLMIYAFQVIMRCPDYSSSDEEPDYYEQYGKEIHQLGVAVHQSRLAMPEAQDVGKAMEKIDPACLDDYIFRREVNRYMNVEALQMVRDGVLDVLVIPQDDSCRYGYPALDQKTIREKIAEYGLEDRVLMYPGADEVELTLFSRLLNRLKGKKPKVYVNFVSEMSKGMIPLYEGCTLATTVDYHILSAGCRRTESYEAADIVLFVTAPASKMEEAVSQPSEKPEYCSERNMAGMIDLMKDCLEEGKTVSILDNAYANGGELHLIRMLNDNDLLMAIDGYAGWNTSANSLGTALAEAVVGYYYGKTKENRDFLIERYIEDVGYCSVVRHSVSEKLPDGMDYFDVKEERGWVAKKVEEELKNFVESYLSSIKHSAMIHTVRMPWRRMFEIELDTAYDGNLKNLKNIS